MRYVQVFMAQAAHTLRANTTHRMDKGLARWLLMTRDRLDGDDLPPTQPLLSNMLGANRPGATLAVRARRDRPPSGAAATTHELSPGSHPPPHEG